MGPSAEGALKLLLGFWIPKQASLGGFHADMRMPGEPLLYWAHRQGDGYARPRGPS